MKKQFSVIDCTPQWEHVVYLLAEAAVNGSKDARAELKRMAQFADKYVRQLQEKENQFK